MTEPRDTLRRYLRERQMFGDPELFVARGEREALLERVATVGQAATPGGTVPAELSRSATREDILALPDLATLEAVAKGCVRCALHSTRTNVVFADGSGAA